MPLATCPTCALPAPSWGLFCGRCGGELKIPSAFDRVLHQLTIVRTLMRNRVWTGVAERLTAIQTTLKNIPALNGQCVNPLLSLGQELASCLSTEINLPRILNVARPVVAMLPTKAFPQLRTRVERLTEFMNGLLQAEKEWAQANAPSTRKVEAWFVSLVGKARLSRTAAHARVYASPQRWPTVAAALDPTSFNSARVLIAIAAAEKKVKDKDYGTACKLYEAILAKDANYLLALEGLAPVLWTIDKKKQAIQCYNNAIRLGTREPRTLNNLSWYLCTSDQPTELDLERAVWAARRAVELAPIGSFWDTLAEALERRKDLSGAIAATRAALWDSPDRTDYRNRMQRLCGKVTMTGPVAAEKDLESSIEYGRDLLLAESATGLPALPPSDIPEATEDSEFELAFCAESLDGDVAAFEEEADEEIIDLKGAEAAEEDEEVVRPARSCRPGKSGEDAIKPEMPRPVTDQVHFSVTAPMSLLAGRSYVLDVWRTSRSSGRR